MIYDVTTALNGEIMWMEVGWNREEFPHVIQNLINDTAARWKIIATNLIKILIFRNLFAGTKEIQQKRSFLFAYQPSYYHSKYIFNFDGQMLGTKST